MSPAAAEPSAIQRIGRNFRLPFASVRLKHASIVSRQFKSYNFARNSRLTQQEIESYIADLDRYGIRPNLAVCKIDDTIGNGVFLKPDQQPIPKGTFIGVYSGEFQISHIEDSIDSHYLFTVLSDIELSKQEIDLIEGGSNWETNQFYLEVEGKNKGNFTRFLNHTSHQLANLEYRYIKMNDGSIQIGIWTKDVVQPGDQLMLDYKKDYWNSLDIDPTIVAPSTYRLSASEQIVASDEM